MTKTIQINRAHYPVTVLGPGNRIGIWLQGCTNGCRGCIAKDTWSADGGNEIEIEALLSWCRQQECNGVDGITISGGEPFEQPEALKSLLMALHKWTDRLSLPVDYLCYSGKSYGLLQQDYPHILSLLDTIIPEPFVEKLSGEPMRGSSNQPIIHLTELGKSRFTEYLDDTDLPTSKRMQFVMEGDLAWFIGIPERGDMDRLAELCKPQGLYLTNGSWK